MQHRFVEHIPEEISTGILYISTTYGTAIHKCCCGCNNDVVTPFSPTDWKLTFDGETVSLSPSIGNWSFKCKSHYFLRNNRVVWCQVAGKDYNPRSKNKRIINGFKTTLSGTRRFPNNLIGKILNLFK